MAQSADDDGINKAQVLHMSAKHPWGHVSMECGADG